MRPDQMLCHNCRHKTINFRMLRTILSLVANHPWNDNENPCPTSIDSVRSEMDLLDWFPCRCWPIDMVYVCSFFFFYCNRKNAQNLSSLKFSRSRSISPSRVANCDNTKNFQLNSIVIRNDMTDCCRNANAKCDSDETGRGQGPLFDTNEIDCHFIQLRKSRAISKRRWGLCFQCCGVALRCDVSSSTELFGAQKSNQRLQSHLIQWINTFFVFVLAIVSSIRKWTRTEGEMHCWACCNNDFPIFFLSGLHHRWQTEGSLPVLSGILHGLVPVGRAKNHQFKGTTLLCPSAWEYRSPDRLITHSNYVPEMAILKVNSSTIANPITNFIVDDDQSNLWISSVIDIEKPVPQGLRSCCRRHINNNSCFATALFVCRPLRAHERLNESRSKYKTHLHLCDTVQEAIDRHRWLFQMRAMSMPMAV